MGTVNLCADGLGGGGGGGGGGVSFAFVFFYLFFCCSLLRLTSQGHRPFGS